MPLGLLTLLVSLAYVPLLPSNAAVGRWVVAGLGAFLLSWWVEVRWTLGHTMFLALLGFMLLGMGWTVSRWETGGELVQWVVLLVVFCVAAEEPDLTWFWRGLCAGVTVSTAFSVAQVLGWDRLWTLGSQPAGLFLSKNMLSDVAVVALVGALGLRDWERLWAVPPALSLVLVSSRASVVALAVAGVLWAWVALPRWWRMGLVSAVFIVAAVAANMAMSGLLGNFSDRLEIWGLVSRHLHWFGDGLGSFSVAAPNLEFAHNEYLHYAFELGVGSVLIWAILGLPLAWGGTRERAALAAFLAICVTWFPLHAPASAFVAVVLAAHLWGTRGRALRSRPTCRVAGPLSLFDLWPAFSGAVPAPDHTGLRHV